MKVLNIISSGYRATLEEQDDTVVWLTHAVKGAGADVDVLLRKTAVNYVGEGQEAAPLSFGARAQKHGPDVHGQVASLLDKGVKVFVLEEDINRHGLKNAPRLRGTRLVKQNGLPELMSQYDQVWHW